MKKQRCAVDHGGAQCPDERKPSKTKQQLETALSYVAAYKDRQDRIVMGLNSVQAALSAGNLDAANTAMDVLMASDLKQSRARVDSWRFALDIAIKALIAAPDVNGNDLIYPQNVETACDDALDHIRDLVPDIFETATSV